MENKRVTSTKCKIEDVVSGKFIKQEGMNPSFVVTSLGRRLSRVRILATVVDKFVSEDRTFSVLTLDDSTATVKAWAFKSSILDEFKKGDIVDIVAKIKQYKDDVYLLPEVVSRINNPNLEILRELELRKEEKMFEEKRKIIFSYQSQAADMDELKRILSAQFNIDPEDVDSILQSTPSESKEAGYKEKILELISSLDKGSGCDYTELLRISEIKEDVIDSVINELLEEGACYEPRPGKIKKL